MSLRTKLIQRLIAVNEHLIFYPRLRRFYRSEVKGPGPVIIDVGANKGQSIAFFRGIYPAAYIHAFEPNRRLYEGLKRKYGRDKGIALSNLGVSAKEGSLLFRENVLDETSTFEELNYDSVYLKKKARVLGVPVEGLIRNEYEVQVTTLSAIISALDRTVDILKIDVEGHELQCLRGLFTGQGFVDVRYIQVESHSDDMYAASGAEDVPALLAAKGFREQCRIRHGFGDFSEVIYKNTRL